jgi:SAM-dependent methyltransferase
MPRKRQKSQPSRIERTHENVAGDQQPIVENTGKTEAVAATPAAEENLNIQKSNVTAYDRHPTIFSTVSLMLKAMEHPRILSFGCSTGEEPLTLAEKYFPTARVVGVDVSEPALAKAMELTAKEPRISIRRSTRETLTREGPFDAIFAMSVLCRWPAALGRDDISDLYPFARFCENVDLLDRVLKPGGLLVIYNANYEFLHTPCAIGYDLIATRGARQAGHIDRFRPDGKSAGPSAIVNNANACVYRKHLPGDAPTLGLRILDTNLARIAEIPRGIPFMT